MRVISGTRKGAKLFSLEGESTRPTTDRVKESLFNIIQWRIQDAMVLDLFAGSGGLGIEAISRGAKHVDFVDINPQAVKIIESNLKKLRYEELAKIFCISFENALKFKKKYDIIFLDPPYDSDYLDIGMELIAQGGLLSDSGVVVCESNKEKTINGYGLNLIKEACYGITKLSFFESGDKNR